jgi:hypothetical protein
MNGEQLFLALGFLGRPFAIIRPIITDIKISRRAIMPAELLVANCNFKISWLFSESYFGCLNR